MLFFIGGPPADSNGEFRPPVWSALIPISCIIFWAKSSILEPPCQEHAMANLKLNFYLQNLTQSTAVVCHRNNRTSIGVCFCISVCPSLSPPKLSHKKTTPKGVAFLWWAIGDSNPGQTD